MFMRYLRASNHPKRSMQRRSSGRLAYEAYRGITCRRGGELAKRGASTKPPHFDALHDSLAHIRPASLMGRRVQRR